MTALDTITDFKKLEEDKIVLDKTLYSDIAKVTFFKPKTKI